eukprot:8869252-Pyramimonas_sp.AAC.1
MLARQLAKHNINKVGTVESRMPKENWAHIGEHLVLHGPRTELATHGCSLWLRRTVPLAPNISRSRISCDTVTVVTASPTVLVVNIVIGDGSLTIV